MQTKSYQRLIVEDLEEISRGLARGESCAIIGRTLGRSTSTISRVVAAEGGCDGFRAGHAAENRTLRAASRRREKRKLVRQKSLKAYVEAGLLRFWSPEEIVARMKMEYPHDITMRIAPETIYQYIYVLPRGELKRTLIATLRQEHSYRHKRRYQHGNRGKIVDMLSIDERPAEVADRTVPGHWEGDLVLGKLKRSALGTLVERTTRKTLLVQLTKKDATAVRRAYARRMRMLPKEFARSLTYDQGKEMLEHKQFTIDTGIQVYFAHPRSPWERGTNENTNGLVRQFFPKGTDFTTVSAKDIKRVEQLLNGRPRKVLHWKTPNEALQESLR